MSKHVYACARAIAHLSRRDLKLPQIIGIGSCGLHAVYEAFQTGVQGTGWELDEILNLMWRLLNDSLSRRDLYISLNRSDLFQLICVVKLAGSKMNLWLPVLLTFGILLLPF